MEKDLRVVAPATVANVACGFDIFGFALMDLGDEVVVRLCQKPGVSITKISGDNGTLPYDPAKNTAGVSVLSLLKEIKYQHGVEIELHKKLPMNSGLGSSASSAAASVFAVNALLDYPLSTRELIPFAMEAERIACGSAHADNVAPALLGGFQLIRSYQPLDIINIPLSKMLYCAILHPKIEVKTEAARKILKNEISLKQFVTQSGNAAGLIVGLMQGDFSLIGRCLEDVVIEPMRASLIPEFYELKTAAMNNGALGCSLSGSGPSLFALTEQKEQAEKIGAELVKTCQKNGLACDLYLSSVNKQGAMII